MQYCTNYWKVREISKEFDKDIKGYVEPSGSVNEHLNGEGLECIDMYLDKLSVPNHRDGEVLSRVGRIRELQAELEKEREVKSKLVDCVEHFAYACENEFAMSVLDEINQKERK